MVSPLAFIEGIGGPELLLIMFVILLLFGANRLPELARGFGKSMREFKKAASGVEQEFKQAMEASETEERHRKPDQGLKTGAQTNREEGSTPQNRIPPPSTQARSDDLN
jgi:sec-independent protein translocase protein TatA